MRVGAADPQFFPSFGLFVFHGLIQNFLFVMLAFVRWKVNISGKSNTTLTFR